MSLLFALVQVLLSFVGRIADTSIFSFIQLDEQNKRALSEKMIGLFRSEMTDVAMTCFVAYSVTFITLLALVPNAEKFGMIDHPDGERKVHNGSKPVIGGIGMFSGVLMTMLFMNSGHISTGFLPAMTLIALTGAIDDRRGVSFIYRFVIQVCATIIVMIYGGTILSSFGDLFRLGPIRMEGVWSWAITVFCVTGVINSINMIDGLDGLAGGFSLVAFVGFGLLAGISGQTQILFIVTAYSGALAAFLYFNWHPARLFMGDAGSMAIGFVLATLSIEITQHSNAIPPVVALLVLSLPVSDTIVVMSRRLFNGKNPFKPDRTHIHHQLLDLGMSQSSVAWIIVIIGAVSSAVGVIGFVRNIAESTLFALWLFCFVIYCIAMLKMGAIYRFVCNITGEGMTPADIRQGAR